MNIKDNLDELSSQKNFIERIILFGKRDGIDTENLFILSELSLITEDLFQLLIEKKILSDDLVFADIKDFLEKESFYYRIPYKAREYFHKFFGDVPNNLSIETIKAELEFYTHKLSEVTNLEHYIVFYKEALKIQIAQYQNAIGKNLNEWFLKHTKILVDSDYLCSVQTQLIDLAELNNGNDVDESMETIFFKSFLYFLIYKNAYAKDEFGLASMAIRNSIKSLKRINPSVLNSEYNEDYRELYYSAYAGRGILYFELNNYRAAYSDIYTSYKDGKNLDNVRLMFRLNEYLGFNYRAENNLLDYTNWLNQSGEWEHKKDWVNASLFDVGTYYFDMGLYKEAHYYNNLHLNNQLKKEKPDTWQALSMRNLGIYQIAMNISKKKLNDEAFNEAIHSLTESIRINNDNDSSRFNSYAYIWLARSYVQTKKFNEAQNYLKKAINSLLTYHTINKREYFECYLVYIDFLKNQGLEQASFDLLKEIYMLAQKNIGSHHPLIIVIIQKIFDYDENYERINLNQHLLSIDKLSSLSVRIALFNKSINIDPIEIFNIIREKNIAFIPFDDDQLELESYDLPFFKTNKLFIIKFLSLGRKIRRYFLYDGEESIILLDGTNRAITDITPIDFNKFSSQQNLNLYLRFYFDCVEGMHGKFYILEDINDIPWKYNLSSEEKTKYLNLIKEFKIRGIQFLYPDYEDEDIKAWNYKIFILFKDSLFSSKVEISNSGKLRLYDEVLLKENLPILVDLKSTIDSIS